MRGIFAGVGDRVQSSAADSSASKRRHLTPDHPSAWTAGELIPGWETEGNEV